MWVLLIFENVFVSFWISLVSKVFCCLGFVIVMRRICLFCLIWSAFMCVSLELKYAERSVCCCGHVFL